MCGLGVTLIFTTPTSTSLPFLCSPRSLCDRPPRLRCALTSTLRRPHSHSRPDLRPCPLPHSRLKSCASTGGRPSEEAGEAELVHAAAMMKKGALRKSVRRVRWKG